MFATRICFVISGKTFVAPWCENLAQISRAFPINIRPANGNNVAPATLCQWSEVPEHAGLVLCLIHTTGTPIVLMVKPDNISVSSQFFFQTSHDTLFAYQNE